MSKHARINSIPTSSSATPAQNRPLKISIEGNIATGKSTFINLLELFNPTSWHVLPEPVSEWTKVPDSEKIIEKNNKQNLPPAKISDSPRKKYILDQSETASPIRNRPEADSEDEEDPEDVKINCPGAANLLDLFYSDTPRWAYSFQSYALLSRMRLQRRPMPKRMRKVKDPVLFYERSLYTDRYIFAKNCAETNLMNPLEWEIYSDWSDYLLDTVGDVHVHGVIYLRCTPDVSYQRLGKRGRPEEKGVTKDYLTQLYNKHEAWLHHKSVEKHPSLYDVPILELDCNAEFETDEAYRAKLFKKVTDFLEECRKDQLKKNGPRDLSIENKENTMPPPMKKSKVVTSTAEAHAKRALEPTFVEAQNKK